VDLGFVGYRTRSLRSVTRWARGWKESRDPSIVRKDHGAVYAQLKRESVLIVCSFKQLDLAKA